MDAGSRLTAGAASRLRARRPGEPLDTVAIGTAADVEQAVAAAEAAGPGWRQTDPLDRGRHLRALADIVRDRMADLAALESAITGRAIREMRAQMSRIPEWLEYFGGIAAGLEGRVEPAARRFPVLHRLRAARRLRPADAVEPSDPDPGKKLAAALAAGNTVVVKPSELAPVTPLLLADWCREAGLPDGVVNVVTGDGARALRFAPLLPCATST